MKPEVIPPVLPAPQKEGTKPEEFPAIVPQVFPVCSGALQVDRQCLKEAEGSIEAVCIKLGKEGEDTFTAPWSSSSVRC